MIPLGCGELSAWNRTAKLLSFNFPKASTVLRDYNRALVLEHPRINSINFFNFPQKHNNRNLNNTGFEGVAINLKIRLIRS